MSRSRQMPGSQSSRAERAKFCQRTHISSCSSGATSSFQPTLPGKKTFNSALPGATPPFPSSDSRSNSGMPASGRPASRNTWARSRNAVPGPAIRRRSRASHSSRFAGPNSPFVRKKAGQDLGGHKDVTTETAPEASECGGEYREGHDPPVYRCRPRISHESPQHQWKGASLLAEEFLW